MSEQWTDRLTGKFLVIDGPDGAGKSTQLALLAERLEAAGVGVRVVRDPGGTAIGAKIRKILLDRANAPMAVACELMLYMASRAQLAEEVIRPALAAGQCVLCDRYISSTVAYQGAGGIDGKIVHRAGRIAVGETWPDLTVLLDLPSDEGLSRTGEPDRMEAKGSAFHRRVRELFLLQAREDPARFTVVDAAGSVEAVGARVASAIENWTARHD